MMDGSRIQAAMLPKLKTWDVLVAQARADLPPSCENEIRIYYAASESSDGRVVQGKPLKHIAGGECVVCMSAFPHNPGPPAVCHCPIQSTVHWLSRVQEPPVPARLPEIRNIPLSAFGWCKHFAEKCKCVGYLSQSYYVTKFCANPRAMMFLHHDCELNLTICWECLNIASQRLDPTTNEIDHIMEILKSAEMIFLAKDIVRADLDNIISELLPHYLLSGTWAARRAQRAIWHALEDEAAEQMKLGMDIVAVLRKWDKTRQASVYPIVKNHRLKDPLTHQATLRIALLIALYADKVKACHLSKGLLDRLQHAEARLCLLDGGDLRFVSSKLLEHQTNFISTEWTEPFEVVFPKGSELLRFWWDKDMSCRTGCLVYVSCVLRTAARVDLPDYRKGAIKFVAAINEFGLVKCVKCIVSRRDIEKLLDCENGKMSWINHYYPPASHQDAKHMTTRLNNLVYNSWKYGGQSPAFKWSTVELRHHVAMALKDTLSTIPASSRPGLHI